MLWQRGFIARIQGMSIIFHMLGCGVRGASTALAAYGATTDRRIAASSSLAIWDRAWQVELHDRPEKALPLYRAAACDSNNPRWSLQRLRALETVCGNEQRAIQVARHLADSDSAIDTYILGGILLHYGRHADAGDELKQASIRLLSPTTMPSDETTPSACDIERCIQDGAIELRLGRYIRAQDYFEQATRKVELALGIYTAWHCATSQYQNHNDIKKYINSCIKSLATLSDALLKYSARTRLASNLAEELRKKQLRADLAPWATGTHDVELLLKAEYRRLSQILPEHWNHAELRYRMGLLARIIGCHDAAERHLRAVLSIHPHYAPAAARLCAILLNRGETAENVSAQTMLISHETLTQHYTLAIKSQHTAIFDQDVKDIEEKDRQKSDPRANIAFALGVLGLLDEEHCEWKNPAPQEA